MSSHIRSKPQMNAMSLTDSTGGDGLESVAIDVLHVLTRNGLLISEDITLCQTLIDSQLDSDITSSPQNSLTFNTNKTVLAVIPLAGALVWFESTLESTYRPVFVSLVGITSWKLSSLLYHYLYKTFV
ncbi:unnamed protein product [Medioppia subpectinata]|uniref:Uncharacterized protein n=1 Tax=Medioppia subpectinata TaxID=1979941 RepID=A0A7R9QIW9_9ACAR|nr:unnamed protein product [Medioppia subpectinata]CAG2121615.1 unnamed protein product [Medioppia subpectinata]